MENGDSDYGCDQVISEKRLNWIHYREKGCRSARVCVSSRAALLS